MSGMNRNYFKPRQAPRPTPSGATFRGSFDNSRSALPPIICDRRFVQSTSKSVSGNQSVSNIGRNPQTPDLEANGTVFGRTPDWMLTGTLQNKKQSVNTCREPTADEIHQRPNGTLIFACDPCSKEYHRKEEWKIHLTTHLQCNYPDCNFEAKSKVLERHICTVHLSKTAKGVTDADNAWISQRRQNFPVNKAEASTEIAISKNKRGSNDKSLNNATDGKLDSTTAVRFPNWTSEVEDLSNADVKIKRLLEEAESTTSCPFKRKRLDRKNLLEKLLQPEIIQERTILLQCIHYLVRNKFFLKPDQLTDTEKKLLTSVSEQGKEFQRQNHDFGSDSSGPVAPTSNKKPKPATFQNAPTAVSDTTSKTKHKNFVAAGNTGCYNIDTPVFAGLPENERWLRPAK